MNVYFDVDAKGLTQTLREKFDNDRFYQKGKTKRCTNYHIYHIIYHSPTVLHTVLSNSGLCNKLYSDSYVNTLLACSKIRWIVRTAICIFLDVPVSFPEPTW